MQPGDWVLNTFNKGDVLLNRVGLVVSYDGAPSELWVRFLNGHYQSMPARDFVQLLSAPLVTYSGYYGTPERYDEMLKSWSVRISKHGVAVMDVQHIQVYSLPPEVPPVKLCSMPACHGKPQDAGARSCWSCGTPL